jgi:autotransporter-associated beta strand protein
MDPSVTIASWIGKFSTLTTTGVIGFDSSDAGNPRTLTGTFDLSPFLAGTSIVLGSATAATLSGSIMLPPLQTNYQFTGYKGGWLAVDAVLTGTRGVRLGSASGDFPEFDPNDSMRMSTVFLNGSNSHTAGTTLFSGRLVMGNASALGTGALTVDGGGAGVEPQLETLLTSSPTFVNQLVVQDHFQMGGVNAFTWSGTIVDGTSTGTIRKHGPANLTLSGNNGGFSGGFTVNEGTLTFASNTAAGTGGLDLGFSSGLAAFTTAAPSVTQLSSQSATSRVSVASGTTLTINQASDSTFRGQIQGAGGIVKAGTGTLRLETAGSFTGGTTITAGTLDVASTGALGNNTVTLNGATANLKIEPGVSLANNLVFGSGGGQLSGHGTFSSSVSLGTNSVVAPGSSVGTLTFANGLTLLSGGSYDLEMQNALGAPGSGWDHLQVGGTLTFAATPTLPFTLNLISLNSSGAPGSTANFSAANPYSWTIASAANFVGFNPAALAIDTSAFTSSLNGGVFSLSTAGGNLQLNFTPVPEPSTWALLLAGLGIVGYRRFRRRS